jgi:transcriptional regulator with XRE-family HTH domain
MEDDRSEDPGAYTRSLGERLRAVRRQRGLSLEAVDRASKREFKDSALSAYERGDRTISVPRLRRLAELYGTTVDDLLPPMGEPRERRDGEHIIDLTGTEGPSPWPMETTAEGSPARRMEELAMAAQELAADASRLSTAAVALLAWLAGSSRSG